MTITVTAPAANPDGSGGPIAYKVYAGATASSQTLLGVVDAFDTAGTSCSSIIDTNTALLTNSLSVTGATAAAGYVSGNTGVKVRGSSAEDIYLIPRNEDFLLRPYTRDLEVINLAPTTSAPDTLPFAIVADCTLAVRAPKFMSRLRNVATTI
jgi:hypothetical protein